MLIYCSKCGAPYLMPELASQLKGAGIKPLFSFTERVSEDMHLPDGTVQKVAVFCHVGFNRTQQSLFLLRPPQPSATDT